MQQTKSEGANPIKRYWALVPAFAAGILAGYFLKAVHPLPQADAGDDVEVRQEGYQLINPLLECEKSEGRLNVLIRSFKDGLVALDASSRKSGTITGSALYFRDMNNGPWFGINENQKFRPASLLKIPIAMSFYKAAEEDPSILSRKLKYEKEVPLPPDRIQAIVPQQQIQLGREYTVD